MLFSPQLIVPVRRAAAAGFTPTSTESGNFLTRATTITSNTDKTRYDALISGVVTDGDFSTLDALYIWAAPDRTAAVLNLIQNAYNATENGTVSFSAYHGYTGDKSTFFLDTGFQPNTASSPQYTLNSSSLGVYIQSNFTSSFDGFVVGASNVGQAAIFDFNGGNAQYFVNGSGKNAATATSQGLWVATRTASNAVALYRNGSTTAFDTDTNASDFVPHRTIYFFGENDSGSLSLPSQAQMSAGFIGGGLSSAAMARIAARINTFMTAYGINVY